jgi:hypothetical protein
LRSRGEICLGHADWRGESNITNPISVAL